jgi:L-alanine-DL-glutamate epimerase-like enolase superfamily enzyme
MRLTWKTQRLPLEFPFGLSRSVQDVAETVLVEFIDPDNVSGIGEAVPAAFYGETPDSVDAFYRLIQTEGLLSGLEAHDIQRLDLRLNRLPGNWAAKAGLSIALHDLHAKKLGLPLYQVWGLDPHAAPRSSYTIGIADLALVRHKTELALQRGYDILKVKVGGPQDLETLQLIRDLAPAATIRVDANAGWTLSGALALMPTLLAVGVEFIEEPLKLDSPPEDYVTLKAESPIPLMADERCHFAADLPQLAPIYDAINIKLTKCGGLTQALALIHTAKALGLKIMLGGFAESSVSVTALSHLSPLVDYADLDGALLLAADPFDGLRFSGSQLVLPTRPGIGVVAK